MGGYSAKYSNMIYTTFHTDGKEFIKTDCLLILSLKVPKQQTSACMCLGHKLPHEEMDIA